MATVRTFVVERDRIPRLWPMIQPGLEIYRRKSPHHIGTDEEVLAWLTAPEGDELLMAFADGQYAGFITFKVQPFEGEVWGTMATIYVTTRAQKLDVLPEIARQLEDELRSRGATIMNYMTARKGFRRLAPSLGFKPRIIEWMKEL